MDRHAHQSSSRRRGGEPLRPDQQEAFDGLLLALLARKRLLVLVGDGAERGGVFGRVSDQVAADGSLVLPVVAQHGMQVEDLVAAAAAAAGIRPPEEEEADFDALIAEVESQLDMAGSGLLAVDDAHLLTPATLTDLAELSRSETGSGRFVQVLLSGSPDLERLLSRPALQQAVRELGVIYRLAGGAAPSAVPQEQPDAAAPIAFTRVYRPAPAVESPHAPVPHMDPPGKADMLASDWTVPPSVGITPPLRHRRHAVAGAWVTAAILVAVGGAGALLAVQQFRPDIDLDRYTADLGKGTESLWASTSDTVRTWSQETFGWPPADPGDALALERSRYPGLPSELPSGLTALPEPRIGERPNERLAALPAEPTATRNLPLEPAPAAPAKPAPLAPPLPRVEPSPTGGDAGPVPPTIVLPATPAVPAVPMPTIPAPPTAPAPVAVAPVPMQTQPEVPAQTPPVQAAPAPSEPSQIAALPAPTVPAQPPVSTADRVRDLVEQARRQMAGKRLTTPPGDNANETVQRIRELAPDSPEIPALVTAMVETYRRWAAQAEKDGNASEAKRYLDRALVVSPNDPALRAQPKSDAPAGRPEPQQAKLPPSELSDGFADQETTLALLNQPNALRAVLAAGHDPNKRLENGKTPLMLAAEAGLRDAVRQLVERGANANLRTRDGATAIMYAAWNGRDDVVSLLADSGANVNAGNDDGKTALMAASARGHAGVVRALLARGAVVDRAANHGWTALMYAAHAGNEPVVRLLVDAGANPARTDQMGNSAITLSRQQGHNQVLGALMGR